MDRPPQFQTQQPQTGAPIPPPQPMAAPTPAPAPGPLSTENTAQVPPMAELANSQGQQPAPTQARRQSGPQWPIFIAIFAVFLVGVSVLGALFYYFR